MFTPLMAVCASSHESEKELLSCVNHLLKFGATADTCERHRMTALMFACKEGRLEIVQRLLDEKIDVNKQDNKGWTALCWSATKGHGRIVRKLLEHWADPSITNNHGQTPSDIAGAAGYNEVCDLLENAVTQTGKEEDCSNNKPISASYSSNQLVVTSCGEMDMILTGLELSHLTRLFHKNKVTLECFLRLNEDDFIRMGVEELGSRKKLLQAIHDIHKQEWKTGSLPNFLLLDHISMPDAVAMIKNINKHIRYIHASIGHLRDQVQKTPRILEIGQEKHNVSTLAECFSDSLKNLSHLGKEITFFKSHLDKVRDNVEFTSADTITIQKDDGRRWQRHLLLSLTATTAALTTLWFLKPNTFASILSLKYYPQPPVTLVLDAIP